MSDNFKLERYKYILGQKKVLNGNTFKVAALFQGAVAFSVAGILQIFKLSTEGRLSIEQAKLGAYSLLGAFLVVCAFCLALLYGGLSAWLDYRTDEASIETEVFNRARPSPRWSDVVKWYEFYIALGIVVSAGIACVAIPVVALPATIAAHGCGSDSLVRKL